LPQSPRRLRNDGLRPGPGERSLSFFGEVDAGDNHCRGEDGDRGERLSEPEDGERNGESRLQVSKNGGFRSLDEPLSFLISPKGDD